LKAYACISTTIIVQTHLLRLATLNKTAPGFVFQNYIPGVETVKLRIQNEERRISSFVAQRIPFLQFHCFSVL